MPTNGSALFQFTPLREGRRITSFSCSCVGYFNSRPSARGDCTNWNWIPLRGYFNSRPSARGDHGANLPDSFFHYFNSRPSARGDGAFLCERGAYKKFQFTPLREGRPDSRVVALCAVISIHAPPRGATVKPGYIVRIGRISIHAPPRGATAKRGPIVEQFQFQFTPLREGRRADRASRVLRRTYFNSRPSARGDEL